MANTYVEYTQVAPTDNNTWTFSCWFKRTAIATEISLYAANIDGSNQSKTRLMADGTIQYMEYQGGSTVGKLTTNRKFRDPSAWYHYVCVWDSDNGTPADRMKMYINGVRETSFSTDTNPSLYLATNINVNTRVMTVGRDYDGGYWKGCMSHVQFVDGLALAPTEFGEFDSTSGIWKIKTGAYATPGNNGFFLKMEDSSNLDLDSSSNAQSFTTSGTLTATKDNPSNNFDTMNPLDNYYAAATFSDGNNHIVSNASQYAWKTSTLAVAKGKWYAECLIVNEAGDFMTGIQANVPDSSATNMGYGTYGAEGWGYQSSTGNNYHSGSGSSYGDTYDDGDYIGVYIDVDNNKLYFSKNGTIQNSGTGITITDPSTLPLGIGGYMMCSGDVSSTAGECKWNFGNGVFGTTTLTGTTYNDVGGIGIFKYDPSSGTFDSTSKDFRAVCTKNIKAYG